jgi:hypothetical protein
MAKLACWTTSLLLCAASLGAVARTAAAAAAPPRPSALVVFVDAGAAQLARIPGLSVGIMSAAQGRISTTQLLLDITQGARVAASAYDGGPPRLSLRPAGGGAVVVGWRRARRRAEAAPQLLSPGLLAARVPGRAAYAGLAATDDLDGVVAADSAGRIATFSLGSGSTLLGRLAALRERAGLLVADLPPGGEGVTELRALSSQRPPGELLIVVQRVADSRRGELLWTAAGGLSGGEGRELTSSTTNERGLIASVDVAPTILRHLGVGSLPASMRGEAIRTEGRLRAADLRAFMDRLRVVGPRRLRALGCLLCAWALLLLAAAPSPRARAAAMRIGAVGVLWAPVAVLISAALEPGAALEYLTIVLACLGLGALTDRLLPWPRAPLAPALVTIVVLVLDALTGAQLLVRSLLGPDPILGARFYGIGNELKSALAVLVLAAVAAALYTAARGRRAARAMLAVGALLAVVEGSARIGAGVGGVILVSAGFALAATMLLPGELTRRRLQIVIVSPLLGLVALAAIDLATAHGSGHFTGSILHARSAGDVKDVLVRRYKAAWGELRNHAMPAATGVALIYAALAVRGRERLLAPVGSDPAWLAALSGGLTAGVVGALAEDSGPVLLVVAVFALGCVVTYLWGRPPTPRSPGRTHAARSRALRPQAAPSR